MAARATAAAAANAATTSTNNEEKDNNELNVVAFQHALDEIATEEKAAYLHARSTVPELVERESPLQRHLVVTDGDMEKAARRLVLYWKYRRELFGEDRAFLPLALLYSGQEEDEEPKRSALGRPEREVFNTGTVVKLPNDNMGRSVMCIGKPSRLCSILSFS